MVKFTSIFFLATLVVSGFAAPHVERGTSGGDLDMISADITAVQNSVNDFKENSNSVPAAMKIHSDCQKLCTDLKEAAADTTMPFSDAQATQILTRIDSFEPEVSSSLKTLESEKSAFDALPIAGTSKLVHNDLEDLLAAIKAYFGAIINACPQDQKAKATDLEMVFVGYINDALKTYT